MAMAKPEPGHSRPSPSFCGNNRCCGAQVQPATPAAMSGRTATMTRSCDCLKEPDGPISIGVAHNCNSTSRCAPGLRGFLV